MKTIWKSKFNWLVFALILITLGLWIKVRIDGTTNAQANYLFSLFLGIVPFVASFKGFRAAKRWGGLSSVLGRSIGALSLGTLLWGVGELIWSYYNLVLNQAAPYPSFADAAFAVGFASWIISALLLSQLAGVNIVLKKKPIYWVFVFVFVAISTVVSYYLLVVVARQGVITSEGSSGLKVFLDFYYPLADFISLTVVTVIAVVAGRYLGGKLRPAILLTMCGLAIMYAGDIIFSYTTTLGTFYNAGPGDLVLLIGMTTLSVALLAYAESVPELSVEGDK